MGEHLYEHLLTMTALEPPHKQGRLLLHTFAVATASLTIVLHSNPFDTLSSTHCGMSCRTPHIVQGEKEC